MLGEVDCVVRVRMGVCEGAGVWGGVWGGGGGGVGGVTDHTLTRGGALR